MHNFFFMEIVFSEFPDALLLFFESLGNPFSEFLSLKKSIKNRTILDVKTNLERVSGGVDPWVFAP